MEVKLSTKKIMLSIIDECDLILREFLSILTTNEENTNPIKLLDLLLDKDAELKNLIPQVNDQIKMQRQMDYLKSEIEKRDKTILSCQLHLRKSEIILNTAVYYSRKKLSTISTAVANPVDPEEVIKYGHRITANHGVVAPPDWCPGDKRRPFPIEENIRNGYLGHVDSVSGDWTSSFLEYASANQEARLSSLYGLAPAREGQTQPQQLPLPSPSPQQSPRVTRTPLQLETAQLPPGVNVVSSPALEMARVASASGANSATGGSFPIATAIATASSSFSATPTGSRLMQQQQPDDVEVMTDSCSSSSSDGF